MRIGFIGGTFSPPHIGHLHSARVFTEEAKLDKLLIIPAKVSPFKTDTAATASDEDRFNMARLCFSELDGCKCEIEISRLELDKNQTSYTIETIKQLEAIFPKSELFMFVGSDMFLSLERWRDFEEIFKKCTIYTRCRQENEMSIMQDTARRYCDRYGAGVIFSDDDEVIVSSTMVREAIYEKDMKKCADLLTDKVLRYIRERGLYI